MLRRIGRTAAAIAEAMDPETAPQERAHAREIDGRLDDLRRKIEAAKATETELTVAVTKAHAALADGSGDVEAVVSAEARLAQGRRAVWVLETLARDLGQERERLGLEIAAAEHAAEVNRQREAARELLDEARRLPGDFKRGVLGIDAPLHRHAAIRAAIRERFPLVVSEVPQIDPDALVGEMYSEGGFNDGFVRGLRMLLFDFRSKYPLPRS